MPETLTIVYFFALALISFALATISILWLFKVRRHLSTLGKVVFEFEDVGRTIPATAKTESFESRIAGCESKADESQNKLAEYETTIDEIASKVRQVEAIIKTHAVDLANTSEKIASIEHRSDDFENNIGDKLNQTANKNEADLAEVITSVNALKDKIENLEKFRTIVQKTHTIIQAAFADMRTGASAEKRLGVLSQTAKPEEATRWSQDEQQEAMDQETSETEAYHYP
jgi:chromosome segregation ATPase